MHSLVYIIIIADEAIHAHLSAKKYTLSSLDYKYSLYICIICMCAGVMQHVFTIVIKVHEVKYWLHNTQHPQEREEWRQAVLLHIHNACMPIAPGGRVPRNRKTR